MTQFVLQHLAYLVVCVAVIGYCILDGFDLGIGSLHLLVKKDEERRIFLNAIGPLWDGNTVWLIIIGGGLFVAFPPVYATLFSAFYTPVMILLVGLIFRAVAIEFRSKIESQRWRNIWDILFSLASILIAFCISVVLGNLLSGIAIDKDLVFHGNVFSFFSVHSILVGIMGVALFMLHGLSFLLMKTEGELQDRIRSWTPWVMLFFAVFYILVTVSTWIFHPHMLITLNKYSILYIIPVLTLIAIVCVPILVSKHREGTAFIASSLAIVGLFSLFGIGTYPVMLRSTINDAYSLTLTNASAAVYTLEIFMTIVIIGIPLVLAYGIWVYRIFRGKVKLGSSSY